MPSVRRFDLGPWAVELEMPRDPDLLLEEIDPEAFSRDERMPYWADVWPAALGLARSLLGRSDLAGMRVLELGCGLALPSFCAAHCGATVLATDYFPEALDLVGRNARRLGLAVRAAYLDWREPEPLEGLDLVIGADLLYEERNIDPLVRLLAVDLREPSEILIADPGRRGSSMLEERLAPFGMFFSTRCLVVPCGLRPPTIRLHRIVRAGTEDVR